MVVFSSIRDIMRYDSWDSKTPDGWAVTPPWKRRTPHCPWSDSLVDAGLPAGPAAPRGHSRPSAEGQELSTKLFSLPALSFVMSTQSSACFSDEAPVLPV